MFTLFDHLRPTQLGVGETRTERWPGLMYAWMPEPWTDTSLPPDADRYCLGVECWNLRRLTFFDADCIVQAIKKRSLPVSNPSLLARALYSQGFHAQAQAVERLHEDGGAGMRQQIKRTHDGSFFQPRPSDE